MVAVFEIKLCDGTDVIDTFNDRVRCQSVVNHNQQQHPPCAVVDDEKM